MSKTNVAVVGKEVDYDTDPSGTYTAINNTFTNFCVSIDGQSATEHSKDLPFSVSSTDGTSEFSTTIDVEYTPGQDPQMVSYSFSADSDTHCPGDLTFTRSVMITTKTDGLPDDGSSFTHDYCITTTNSNVPEIARTLSYCNAMVEPRCVIKAPNLCPPIIP